MEYKQIAVQIRLLLSYNIVKDHVSLDLGPVLQINDKLKFDSKYEHNLLEDNILLTAKDISVFLPDSYCLICNNFFNKNKEQTNIIFYNCLFLFYY
ncbi:hypothetical protein FEDK69T_05740 [Flavobacterium enshiense DK69]|nr:hypothetical protein FEDK69T_05740 [Flavobacterium enshiense DK69]